MREPAAGWLSMVEEDEAPDDIEFDPRWEVQPVPAVDDDAGGHRHWTFIAAVAIVMLVASVVWLMMGTPPAA